MATHRGSQAGLFDALLTDLRRFHEHWMALLYPRQVGAADTVLGKWKPQTTGGRIGYQLWGVLGALIVGVLYPVVLVGVVLRFHARRIDATASWLGGLGVLVVAGVVWGLLALVARARFPYEGFLAVAAAGGVATVSAVSALFFARIDGRTTTVLLAYPLGVTAFFLPPVVAALYSPLLARVIFPGTESLSIWLLDNVLAVFGLADPIRAYFDLVGVAYVLVWFGLSVPVGWLLGGLVTLADVVRPR